MEHGPHGLPGLPGLMVHRVRPAYVQCVLTLPRDLPCLRLMHVTKKNHAWKEAMEFLEAPVPDFRLAKDRCSAARA